MPVATIDSANMVTLFTEDGKVVHRLVYNVRNSSKQFLEIKLPQKADVWSVFVDKKPVESSLNMQGSLLVPLIKSRAENALLKAFPVEVIYCMTENRFTWSGSLTSHLPSIDLMTSQLIWSVYLPNEYTYHYFDSSLEKEEIIQGINVFTDNNRQYDEKAMNDLYQSKDINWKELQGQLSNLYKGNRDYRSSFKNVPIQTDEISSQLNAELEFTGRLNGLNQQKLPQTSVYGTSKGAGVMPIQIKIPAGGQVYRFAKTIVKGDDPLNFKVVYSRNQTTEMAKWGILLIIIGCIYLIRRKTINLFVNIKNLLTKLYDVAKKNKDTIKTCAQSKMTPFILFGFMFVCLFVSIPLSILVFFLFWISAGYHIVLFWNKKEVQKATPENNMEQYVM